MLFLSLIFLSYITIGMPDALLGASWPLMQTALSVPVSSAGFLSLLTSCGTIFASLFSHRVTERFGTGRVMAASFALMALALLGTALSPGFLWLLCFALPLGLGVGAVDSGLNVYVARHYQARHMNWLHCFWGLGAMAGPLLVSFSSGAGFGWQGGYFTYSIVQFILAGLLLYSLPAWKKREGTAPAAQKSPAQTEPRQGSLSLLKGKGARLAAFTFFLYTAIESNMMLWGATYLVGSKNVSPQTAAGWVSLLFLGITIGRLLSGFVSMKLTNQTLIRLSCFLIMAGFALLALPLKDGLSIAALVLIGLGFAPIFPTMMHETPRHFTEGSTQAAIGLQMAFAYVGNILMPPLLGYLYAALSFSWLPGILFFMSLGLYACTSYLFKWRKAKPPLAA